MAGPSWSVQTQAFPSRPARHHAPLGPQTRRQRDRTTTFPCSSHGWPWPVQFPGTQMEPSGAGPFGRGGARERTEFSPSGGNGGEKRGGPKAAIPALGRGGTAERTRGPRRGTRGMRSLCRRCDDDGLFFFGSQKPFFFCQRKRNGFWKGIETQAATSKGHPLNLRPAYLLLPPAGHFRLAESGQRPVKEGDLDFPLLDKPPLETTYRGATAPL